MSTIVEYDVQQHSLESRETCAGCGRRRLTTRCTLTNVGTGERLVRWFCNPCLVETPNWSRA
jgi:hypothetical protein